MKKLENAKITHADLSMADYGCLTLAISLEGNNWGTVFGGYCIGKGYLGATRFAGSGKGIEEIMRIMDVVGVDNFSELKGKYVRVEVETGSSPIKKIGHIIKDKWFDYNEFYKEAK